MHSRIFSGSFTSPALSRSRSDARIVSAAPAKVSFWASYNLTEYPARANTIDHARPINPAPITAIGSDILPPFGFMNKELHSYANDTSLAMNRLSRQLITSPNPTRNRHDPTTENGRHQ